MAYEGLRFSFSEMDKEIDNMNRLSTPFIELDSSQRVIPVWRQELTSFRQDRAGNSISWEIRQNDPIQTKVSTGSYEAGARRGRLKVFGRISGKWEITLPGDDKKKNSPSREFILKATSLASTEVSIWSIDPDLTEVARWTIEIGNDTSPGCHFHTQITLDAADNKFPAALSVPRLPGLLHTPMDALDFVLGELFQDDWYRVSSERNNVVNAWAACQKNRIVNLLQWQTERLNNTNGSPWIMLKRQKPAVRMLIGDK